MKKVLLLFMVVVAAGSTLHAQILKSVADKAKQKVLQRADQKVDNKMEEGLDKIEGKNKVKTTAADGDIDTEATFAGGKESTSMQAYSKYDFVQGEKVVAFDNFERAAVGDFPTSWNTNGAGEIVTINKQEGKWLKINSPGFYHPEFIKELPENATLEFDLAVSPNFQWGSSAMHLYVTSIEDRNHFSNTGYYGPSLLFDFHPLTGENGGGLYFRTENQANSLTNNANIKNWNNGAENFAHVSLWRQGQRLRMYVNGSKILDLPRAFQAGTTYSDLVFMTHGIQQEAGDYWLIGNIRLATGAPDTRNKLISEGKFVTSGITFDVNSDKIKPESFGILKEIASALQENALVNIKIIGHTDSDGDAAKNLELSKRRAAAVKAALSREFNIGEGRMETDGHGATKPVADNKTQEGKAQNRRVEFVKL